MFVQRWKANARKPYVWVFVVIAVLTALIPAFSSRFASQTKLPIGLVNEDRGPASLDLENYMGQYDRLMVFELDRETALRYLAMGRLEAVYILEDGFSDRLQAGEYEGIVTMYTAPASSAAVLLSETVINGALETWMVETALLRLDEFLQSEEVPFPEDMREQLRAEFKELLSNGSSITVVSHIPAPAETGGPFSVLLASLGWFADFVALFVITGAGWVIESRSRALGERLRAAGIRPLSTIEGSSLSVVAMAMLGWLVTVVSVSLMLGYPLLAGLPTFLPMLLYLLGIMGITLLLACLLESTVQLMLIAPVFTVAQGVVCGMLVTLPDWAGFLNYVAWALPGRPFMLAAAAVLHGGNPLFLLAQTGNAALWLALGVTAALAASRRAMASAD
jgi:hypothetical protein